MRSVRALGLFALSGLLFFAGCGSSTNPFDIDVGPSPDTGADTGSSGDASGLDTGRTDVTGDASLADTAATGDTGRSDASTPTDASSGDAVSRDVPATDSTPTGCADRSLGSALGASVATGTTSGDTRYEGSCGGEEAPEALFTWTAPSAGRYTFDTFGSGYDTVLYLNDGTCDGSELECNDDSSEDVQSEVTVTLREGQTVVIVVDGYADSSGAYVLNITRSGSSGSDGGAVPTDAAVGPDV